MSLTLGKVQREMLDALNREIAAGNFKVGDSLGNERSLALRFKVSRTTTGNVIRYLAEQGLVEDQGRQGIILKKKSTAMFAAGGEKAGLLFIRLNDNALGTEIYSGVEAAPEAEEFKLSLADAGENPQTFLNILRHIPDNIKTIMLFPVDHEEIIAEINGLMARGVSVIQIDRINDSINSPGITFDNFSGGLQATLHLIRQHNLPVYYLGDAVHPESMAKRYKGWRTAMRESGYGDADEFRIPGFDDQQPCELQSVPCAYLASLESFLQSRRRQPTAIFAGNDYMAQAVYQAAAKNGLTVGKDVLLVGFDDLELCSRLTPTLSSIRVPRRQLGREAMEMAAALSEGNCVWRKILPVELVVRASSAR